MPAVLINRITAFQSKKPTEVPLRATRAS